MQQRFLSLFEELQPLQIGLIFGSAFVGFTLLKKIWPQPKPGVLNVVITGASKGLGRALLIDHLCRGDNVVACSRSISLEQIQTELAVEVGSNISNLFTINCDVCDEKSVRNLVEAATSAMGRIDRFICNAGLFPSKLLPLNESPVEEMRNIILTNGLGVLLCSKYAIQQMKTQKPKGNFKGHIVIVSGGGGQSDYQTPGFAAYGSVKAGQRQLVNTLQDELKNDQIGVHLLHPGMMLTDMITSRPIEQDERRLLNIFGSFPSEVSSWAVPHIALLSRPASELSFRNVLTMMVLFFSSPLWAKNRFVDEASGVLINKNMKLN